MNEILAWPTWPFALAVVLALTALIVFGVLDLIVSLRTPKPPAQVPATDMDCQAQTQEATDA